jgi:alkanesulfonate monooxygenase SsuD/methylene tetrahydromethanopterin reductase-like flavin-dependent oxidoreductase (luciferase family)
MSKLDRYETESAMATTRGYGIAGSLDHAIVEPVAAAVERAGYTSFWANDTPNGDGLASLAAAARVTDRINLGVGVIPVDRTAPAQIAARVAELGLPLDRLIVGLGSGGAKIGTVELVRRAVVELKALLSVRVYVGALGPRMCRLGGEVADGLLLSWLTPDAARDTAEVVRQGADAAGRAMPHLATYLRGALPAAEHRLRQEADRYASFPVYTAHFARIGAQAIDTTLFGTGPEMRRQLAAYEGILDEVVVRAIAAEESVEAYLDLVTACAPAED